MIVEDPSKSIRSMARESRVDEKTVQNFFHEHSRYKSYALKRLQFMNEVTMERRTDKAAKLLCKLKNSQATNQLIFFSDEKKFFWDQKGKHLITDYAIMFRCTSCLVKKVPRHCGGSRSHP